VGVDPPDHITPQTLLIQGEERNGYGLWKDDLYGAKEALKKKRADRGWDKDKYVEVIRGWGLDEGLIGLIEWDGGESGMEVYEGELPWKEFDNFGDVIGFHTVVS
jgi:hypothetical protein